MVNESEFHYMTQQLNRIEYKLDEIIKRRKFKVPPKFYPEWMTIHEAHLVSRVAEYTLRQACNLGRIVDCHKTENGSWRISRTEVEQIRDHGLPPLQSPKTNDAGER